VALVLLTLVLMHVPVVSMSTGSATILLVEDDVSLQGSLRGFLEDHGFRTQTAGTVAEGREVLRALRPAVCLLDLNLPDGSGAELLKVIEREGLGVRAIVMSAFPPQRLREQFGPGVLAALMTKPVSPQHLLEWVDRIVGEGGNGAG
jgi:DNA-binding NtrC family response regulator